jgi:hypothetical protein
LRRLVELELVVGSNVTSASRGVGQDTVLERDGERAGRTAAPLLHVTLGGAGDGTDLKGTIVVGGAQWRARGSNGRCDSRWSWSSVGNASGESKSECGTHDDDYD